jgi:hypothetical protein
MGQAKKKNMMGEMVKAARENDTTVVNVGEGWVQKTKTKIAALNCCFF